MIGLDARRDLEQPCDLSSRNRANRLRHLTYGVDKGKIDLGAAVNFLRLSRLILCAWTAEDAR